MSNHRINVVGVPRCRPTENGTQMDIETEQGQHLELAMTPEAFRQWAASCACPSTPTAVDSYKCTPGPEHVIMTIGVRPDASADFLLSHGEAVLLATRLLQAAKDARNQSPQG